MPFIELKTNLDQSRIPVDFNEKTTNFLAEIQNKPSSKTMVSIITNQIITFGGTHEPCAYVQIKSIGNQTESENRQSSMKITEYLNNILNIHPERILIFFNDYKSKDVGWNGRIYSDIFNN